MADFGTDFEPGLVAALAAGLSVREAAVAAGMAERTAYRRLADPGFKAAVSAARGAMLDRAVGKLAETSTHAADCLAALLTSDDDRVRLAAARSILELGPKLREATELADRVAAAETALRDIRTAEGQEGCLPIGARLGIDRNHATRVQIVERDDWYGNDAHQLALAKEAEA